MKNKTKKITLDALAAMIKKGFDENTGQHSKIFSRLNDIDKKLEGIVYRNEFDKLQGRVTTLENLLAVNSKK